MAASSAELKKTLVSFPIRFGKFLVEVDMTVDPWLTTAWLPTQREQPGISKRAPESSNMSKYPSI